MTTFLLYGGLDHIILVFLFLFCFVSLFGLYFNLAS